MGQGDRPRSFSGWQWAPVIAVALILLLALLSACRGTDQGEQTPTLDDMQPLASMPVTETSSRETIAPTSDPEEFARGVLSAIVDRDVEFLTSHATFQRENFSSFHDYVNGDLGGCDVDNADYLVQRGDFSDYKITITFPETCGSHGTNSYCYFFVVQGAEGGLYIRTALACP